MSAFETSSDITKYLAPGERVLWEGRSRRGLRWMLSRRGDFDSFAIAAIGFVSICSIAASLIAQTAAFLPFLILVIGGIAVFMLERRGGGFVLILLIASSLIAGTDVLLASLILVIGIIVVIILYRPAGGSARYVVTSAAAMIVSESRWTGKRVTVVPLKSIPVVSLTENRDGTGTLVFGQNPSFANVRYAGGRWMDARPAFWNIERPLEVYQLIRRQMAAE